MNMPRYNCNNPLDMQEKVRCPEHIPAPALNHSEMRGTPIPICCIL